MSLYSPNMALAIAEIAAGVKDLPNFLRYDLELRFMLVQPQHFFALHAAHEIGFGYSHGIRPCFFVDYIYDFNNSINDYQ